jgi:hypothetical protein
LTTAGSPPPIITQTPTPLQRCQLSVPGSTPVSGVAAFANIPFRPSSSSKVLNTFGGGVGQFTVTTYSVCAPATAVADIVPFYTAQMPANGWAVAPDFPINLNGQLHQACVQCWQRESKTRKAAVSSPLAGSSAGTTIYQLLIATPPPIPVAACRANEYSPATPTEFTTSFAPDIPLPPLSTQTLGEGAPGISNVHYCSAGTVASVNAFFTAALPASGWTLGSLPAATVPACASGRAPVSGWVKGGNRVLEFTIPNGPSYAIGFKWSLTLCTPGVA